MPDEHRILQYYYVHLIEFDNLSLNALFTLRLYIYIINALDVNLLYLAQDLVALNIFTCIKK